MGCSIIAARVEYGAFSPRPMKMPPPVPGIKEAYFTFGPLPVLSVERPLFRPPASFTLLNYSSHNICADFTTSILLSDSAKSNSFHRIQPRSHSQSIQGYLLIRFKKFSLVLRKQFFSNDLLFKFRRCLLCHRAVVFQDLLWGASRKLSSCQLDPLQVPSALGPWCLGSKLPQAWSPSPKSLLSEVRSWHTRDLGTRFPLGRTSGVAGTDV